MSVEIVLRCDACPECYGDLSALTLDDARTIADANGWTCEDDIDLCPAHRNVDQAWLRASHEGLFL